MILFLENFMIVENIVDIKNMLDDVVCIIACNNDDFENDSDINSSTMLINSINVNENVLIFCDMRVDCN